MSQKRTSYDPANVAISIVHKTKLGRGTWGKHKLTSSRHVPNPLHTAIITLLKHLQIPDQQPRTREHKQREIHAQRRPTPRLLVRHARQLRLSIEHVFRLAREALNLPHDIILAGLVLRFALADALGDARRVQGRGDLDDDVRSEKF